jgi:nucleoside-diphosphate-sugar epimerase
VNLLVTGGAGFIGSHLCARLLEDGHQVVCVDNLLTGSERFIDSLRRNRTFTFLRHDVIEPFDPGLHLDAIFHLASPASPLGYWTYPFETMRVNSEGTYHLLELARRDTARFLFSSTSESYGDPEVHPQPETYWGHVNPVGVRACYDEGKRLGETLTIEFHRRFGTDARVVRIFNTYGPHNMLDDGRMVPTFITAALQNQPIPVHGDGSQTRSLCYVDDLVEGLVRAMFAPGTAGEVYNLGNPDEHTVLEWAKMVTRLCDSASPIEYRPRREDDPERRRPVIEKARQALSWEPRTCPEEGLRRTIVWAQAELERQGASASSLPASSVPTIANTHALCRTEPTGEIGNDPVHGMRRTGA